MAGLDAAGDSAYSGRLAPLTFDRAPLTFSVSLESLAGGARSATLSTPSLSSYRDAIGAILAQEISGSTPARISAEVDEVSSEEQLAVALGAAVSAPLVATVKAGFNFSDTSKRSRFVVKFFQLYYTVDVDPPGLPHTFFAPTVTVDDIAAMVGQESPPLYVSSIGYGRQVIFTFESDLSKQELQAALTFVYQGGAEISGSVSLTHQEVLSHTHTTAFILGGDAGEAASASIGSYAQLKAFIAKGGNYSKDSPGAAIAYKLSYVRDHQLVQVGGDLEIFGTVAALGSTGTRSTLASWSRDQYKQIAQGASFPPSGIIGEAIVKVRPESGNKLRIRTTLFENDAFSDGHAAGHAADRPPARPVAEQA